MITFSRLYAALAGRVQIDMPCPLCAPGKSPSGQVRKVLRVWRLSDSAVSYICQRCEQKGAITSGESKPLTDADRALMARRNAEARAEAQAERDRKRQLAMKLWRESTDSKGAVFVERYLRSRGLQLPRSTYTRRRNVRFHPACPFPDKVAGPAMLCGLSPILIDRPAEPFFDPPIEAIHRIRGRGHDNKAMLGEVKGRAFMLGDWEEVADGGVLHVCEGCEDALSLYGEGNEIEEHFRPVWGLGSAGALESFPVLSYCRRLVIFVDNDASGRGQEAAKRLTDRYSKAGRFVEKIMKCEIGRDFGEQTTSAQ
jgi:hypothetical protein